MVFVMQPQNMKSQFNHCASVMTVHHDAVSFWIALRGLAGRRLVQ